MSLCVGLVQRRYNFNEVIRKPCVRDRTVINSILWWTLWFPRLTMSRIPLETESSNYLDEGLPYIQILLFMKKFGMYIQFSTQ